MVDYADSSQLNLWQFDSPEALSHCRALANRKARDLLFRRSQQLHHSILNHHSNSRGNKESKDRGGDGDSNQNAAAATTVSAHANATPPSQAPSQPMSSGSSSLPVEHFACGFSAVAVISLAGAGAGGGGSGKGEPPQQGQEGLQGPWTSPQGHSYLTSDEEQVLVSFYVSKLPSLVGPGAPVVRCRRESKVAATAALLTRRFFLSNSVMIFDPKAVMVAAAFLASKVEDATIDVRYLEEGTAHMNAPVTKEEIIPAEICLLAGTHFDLLCFHPLKCVLAVTEDLRTYLKSDQGQGLVHSNVEASEGASSKDGSTPAPAVLSGQNLKPIYDAARALLDDALVSDLPLLFNPGHVGLAALIVGQEVVQEASSTSSLPSASAQDRLVEISHKVPRIDLEGYIRQRFGEGGSVDGMLATLRTICGMIRELKQGMWGCGNHLFDLGVLKSIHKKLKKVRAWGLKEAKATSSSKKRDRDTMSSPPAVNEAEPSSERPTKKAKKATTSE